MTEKEKLLDICQRVLTEKGLNDELHNKRLNLELKEIDGQNEYDYFLGLYEKKIRYAENQNNLLIPYLLGVVDHFSITKEPNYVFGDYPDCDTDYLPIVRDYLKQEWAPKHFGADKVCNIGSYNTFGIKSSLIDMARVFGKSRSEILDLTTKIGLKDEDGKSLTWDKALEMYPELKKYCDENPEVADAAHKLINRNKSMGKHAGGLIVSSVPIDNFVPLMKDKDGLSLSAWVEGLHGQDLGPVGLIKFDLLVVTNLMQIAIACKLIKERYGLTSICALPGQQDWSDVSYLDDPKSLEMANAGDLKCVFQFDSDGIRQMAKAGGVTSFNDLVAYTSLYRPSSLSIKMHERYIERKRGREPYELHPLLEPFLGKTYGVMCVHGDGLVAMADGRKLPMKKVAKGDLIHVLDEENKVFGVSLVTWAGFTKKCDGLNLILENGFSTVTTPDHRIFTNRGWVETQNLDSHCHFVAVREFGELRYVRITKIVQVFNQEFYDLSVEKHHNFIVDGIVAHNCFQEQVMRTLNVVGDIPLKDCEIIRKAISKKKIESFAKYKEMFITNGQKNLGWTAEKVSEFWDQIEMWSGYGFNLSHACSYTYISSRLLWLKAHYPLEFFAAILSCEEKTEKLKEYKLEAARHGVRVMPVDINKSGIKFRIVGNTLDLKHDWIYFGLSSIKGIGEAVAKRIVENQDYKDFTDFLNRFGIDATVLKPLIGLRVFKESDPVSLYKYYEWFRNVRKRREERRRRKEKRCEELAVMLKEHLPPSLHEELAVFTEEILEKTKRILADGSWPYGERPELDEKIQDQENPLCDTIEDIHIQYYRAVDSYNKKISLESEGINQVAFDPDKIEIPEELKNTYCSLEASETAYYGFLWTHPLERSPDYVGGMTFDAHRSAGRPVNPVEVRVKKVEKTLAKNKKTEYYLLQLEDACGEVQQCQVWMDDWERFGDDLTEQALVRIRVKAPDGGWSRYTMDSFPKHKKHLVPRNKADDARVFVMRRGSDA